MVRITLFLLILFIGTPYTQNCAQQLPTRLSRVHAESQAILEQHIRAAQELIQQAKHSMPFLNRAQAQQVYTDLETAINQYATTHNITNTSTEILHQLHTFL